MYSEFKIEYVGEFYDEDGCPPYYKPIRTKKDEAEAIQTFYTLYGIDEDCHPVAILDAKTRKHAEDFKAWLEELVEAREIVRKIDPQWTPGISYAPGIKFK